MPAQGRVGGRCWLVRPCLPSSTHAHHATENGTRTEGTPPAGDTAWGVRSLLYPYAHTESSSLVGAALTNRAPLSSRHWGLELSVHSRLSSLKRSHHTTNRPLSAR